MRAIRTVDGVAYPISGLPNDTTYAVLLTHLSELSTIPVRDLIAVHPTGRQLDVESVRMLVALGDDVESKQGMVYLFDRQLLDVNLDGPDGAQLLSAIDLDAEEVLFQVRHDATAQRDTSLDLINSIQHQYAAVAAALLNLDEHQGGSRETIQAYFHFASPLLTKYRNLLDVYPASMALASRVSVTGKMQVPHSVKGEMKDRLLSDFVSREKMESVRGDCQKTLDDLMKKHDGLETLQADLSKGMEQMKEEGRNANLDDLDECERDAIGVCDRIQELQNSLNSPEDGEELAGLEEDVMERIQYLVARRNSETRQLIASQQRISELQSRLAESTTLTVTLNTTLRTKCDGFKHLARLQSLVPSYVATLAESIRRRIFTNALKDSSTVLAEILGKFNVEEKKRRSVFQAEWAGKLPWGSPGLEESVPQVDVDVRSSSSSLKDGSGGAARTSPTLEDLENLATALAEVEDGLEPEDMPSPEVAHPVKEALQVVAKCKKQILALQEDFMRFTAKMEGGTEDSPVTSVDVSKEETEQLRLAKKKRAELEEKRDELERELQTERTAREQEVSELTVKIAELTRANEEERKERAGATDRVEKITKEKDDLAISARKAEERATRLDAEGRSQSERVSSLVKGLEETREELKQTNDDHQQTEEELTELQDRFDELASKQQDLLETLAEKERTLRDYKTEAELDKATLENQLVEEKEKVSQSLLEKEQVLGQLEEVRGELAREKSLRKEAEKHLSQKEDENAEIQVTCNGWGKALAAAQADSASMQTSLKTLLNLFRLFYDSYVSHLKTFIDEPIPMAQSSASPTKESSVSSAPAYTVPAFDATSLDTAVASLQKMDSSLIELAKTKIDLCAQQTKKWMKECKRYKDRATKAVEAAKEKLAFKSFAKGDLALLLPTRNPSVPQAFAAFNYCRPNYFLRPTGEIADQVQNREWIVARITSITQAAVDAQDPTSNPYALVDGSVYFMLEAEPYTSKGKDRIKGISEKQRPDELQQQRRASTSNVMSLPSQSNVPTSMSNLADMASSAFTVIEAPLDSVSARPHTQRSFTLPAPGPSSLSAARPAVLEPVIEAPTPIMPTQALPSPKVSSPPTLSTPGRNVSSAFLPINPASHQSSSARDISGSIPKSLGSSNGSGSMSSTLQKRMSSSFLKSGKASATTATSTNDGDTSKSWTTPLRQTQTIGIYAGRKDRRRESASMISSSSAADLLRSFTTDSY